MADLEKDLEETVEATAETEEELESCQEAEAEVEETESASEETEGEEKKSRLFGKKEKKDKKDQQIEELNDRLMRQMAEFDNFRKRTDREKSQMFDAGASTMIEKLLPVIDDMERGLAAMTDAEKETAFAKGIEMIYKKLCTILNDNGITAIEAVGKEFDPNFHNAVMQMPSEEYESGFVVQELQKGYMYKEKVIRHSMVMVAE